MAENNLILFSDRRLREHHRRQSVTVDDTDVMLHRRANRRSILFGGESKGPKFWSQLSAAWTGNSKETMQSPLQQPSPTSVRDVQPAWSAQQEKDILKASQNLALSGMEPPSTEGNDDDDSGLLKVSYSVDTDGSSHRTSVTSCSTQSSHGMDQSNASSDPSHPFLSVWDRLDALSIREHRRLQAYHQTVNDQNDQIHSKTQLSRGGRLRRQNSWNGRDSQRNLHVAQNSIIAEVDDCSLRHLLGVLQGDDNGKRHGQVYDHIVDGSNTEAVSNNSTRGVSGNVSTHSQGGNGTSRNSEYVMNLVL